MIAVVDVSAAMEILLHKEQGTAFSAVLMDASWVIAPELYIAELANVLWKYHRSKALSHAACVQYVEQGIALIDDFVEGGHLWKEALAEGMKHGHSVYDMYYVILARRNDAVLLTRDGALLKLCNKLKIPTAG